MDYLQEKKDQVKLLNDQFYQATIAKDGNFIINLLHKDFVFTSPRAIVLKKESFVNDFVLNPSVMMDVFELEENHISLDENVAICTGVTKAKFKDKDGFLVRVTLVFIYKNFNWQLIAFQETFIP